jgi:hypothetical protein
MNFGAKFTYRQLKSTIDDFCDQRPFDKWLAKHPEVNAITGVALVVLRSIQVLVILS